MSILLIVLFISLSLLNNLNKLIICAALVTVAALVVNLIVEFYGKRKAMYGLITCTLLCCILKWQDFSLMILTSYTAVLVSLFSSIIFFEKLESKFGFHITNFITLITVSVIDSTVMYFGLLYKFSVDKCLSICIRDLALKFSYASMLSICLFVAAHLFYLAKRKYTKLYA
ncbi:hypothetical protein GO684_02355 [Wolbachia endosymbiont of Litomosoides brasiliensis]|uniref:hypothetical protein n=1 Tax=Wolbachia endosymbiont of Litomosoides brasiliensis TaxID=1812117 RepID=UPI00158A4277|nr:hypothetical protein [Wolbachia endosymbiont of Litomosoides brasiliensis]NUY39525.1 hypothetical protein [Wolbachia endosymbiont of Litomosoides brasiliensis]